MGLNTPPETSPSDLSPTRKPGRSRERTLIDYGNILYRRRWAIYLMFAIVFVLVAATTLSMTPVYRATAILEIEKDNPRVLTFEDIVSIDSRDELFYQTQYLLIQSRTVARRVLDSLGIDASEADPPAPGLLARMKKSINDLLGRRTGPSEGVDPETRLVDGLLERIQIEPYRNSRLVAISFMHTDPQVASDTANAIARAYIDHSIETKFSATDEAARFLARQIESLKKEIVILENDLQEYGTRNEIVALKEGENITAKKLSDFSTAYIAAQADRIRKEARYRSLKEASLESIPQINENPVVQQLKVRLADLERTYSQKLKTYKPHWPEMIRLRSEMDKARSGLDAEIEELRTNLLRAAEADYHEAVREERSLAEALESQKAEAVRVNRDSIKYANLKMEVDNKRNLLRTLLERQSEMGLSSRLRGMKNASVRVVDAAELPLFPHRPRVKLNLMMGMLLGLGLGVGLALLLDHLDSSVKSAEDLQLHGDLPTLGVIPPFDPQSRGPRVLEGPAEVALLSDPNSTVAEAYRSLRTSFLLSLADEAPRAVLVTSTQQGEGKTITTINVAVALVQAGKRVLLIDCDLRRPRLHKVFGVPSSTGLTSCLTGITETTAAVKRTGEEGLDLLPCGAIPPNPSELLASKSFDRLLSHFINDSEYDHVLIDSPPALMVSDARILAAKVQGIVMVVQADRIPREALRLTVEALRQSGTPLLGAVLNRAEPVSGDSYRYRYYAYAYGYGKKDGKGRYRSGRRSIARLTGKRARHKRAV